MLTFTEPATSFYARLDEIAAMARDREPMEHDWPAPADIEWLRSAFARNWPTAYPQPFVGIGPEDAMLSLYWKSAAATITLEIDTRNRMGDLYRTVPNCAGDQDETLELNLSSAYAWRKIGMALGSRVWTELGMPKS